MIHSDTHNATYNIPIIKINNNTVCINIYYISRFYIAGHPRFFNQLSCGLDIVSMAGEWLTATANTNMFTYEIAPVFILMENVVLAKMREIIGWKTGDSIFAPGDILLISML